MRRRTLSATAAALVALLGLAACGESTLEAGDDLDSSKLTIYSAQHKNLTEEARAELGIGGGTLRLSVGLEDVDDLAADVAAALERSGR